MRADDTLTPAARAKLDAVVVEADIGGRTPSGFAKALIFWVALGWVLFQLWYASPFPFTLGIGVFNDTEARSIHLTFALTLAFLTFPFLKSSPRNRLPTLDWFLAGLGAASTLYLYIFYEDIADRQGWATTPDTIAAVVGVLLLLEAARRTFGPALPIIASLVLAYLFAGPYLSGLEHRGASLSYAASKIWLASQGVFGVAIGVSTSFIFLYVLFGSLLEKAGAGYFFIRLAYSLLGRFRGGPAKAGVVASGMTGMISGSSIANTVTTGTFTIPLMKRVGYPPTKAGAIECASSVNGQIMPPVMGAAAFIIAEYVGVSYAEIVKHAFVPAILTFGALFYIVDIEAMKMRLVGIPRTHAETVQQRLLKMLLTVCGIVILAATVQFGVGAAKAVFGAASIWVIGAALFATYIGLLWNKACYPASTAEEPSILLKEVPGFFETARSGLHFLIPVIILIWCLMIERLSPGLSAFWGVMALMFIVLTQRPIIAFFQARTGIMKGFLRGFTELIEAFQTSARNMTGVGIATATAGIIVGVVGTGDIGLRLIEIVETVSGGYLIIMLMLTAVICLILGMGMPTTASYVVVATLMAPVLVEVAAQNGVAAPLVAIHLFVFYFGLMADVTPPVGLAAYAASAIAGSDPVKTGVQAFKYESRTVLLPFIFIFNAQLLLIDINSWWHFTLVLFSAIIGMGAFVAATQHWLITKNRLWETAALLLICFTMFRPGFWLDFIEQPFAPKEPSVLMSHVDSIPKNGTLRLRIATEDRDGHEIEKLVRLTLWTEGTAQQRLHDTGLSLAKQGNDLVLMEKFASKAKLKSQADKYGLLPDDRVKAVLVPADRASPYWFTLPALALFGMIFWRQRQRKLREQAV
jgi:TRAP-type uncharacterized transport system fused permease subunit